MVVVFFPGRAHQQFEGGHDAEEQAAEERLNAETAEAGEVVDDPPAGEIINHHAAPEQEQEAGDNAGPGKSGGGRPEHGVGRSVIVVVFHGMVGRVMPAASGTMRMVVSGIRPGGVAVIRRQGHGSVGAGVGQRISRRRPAEG